jgi:hypothetical protein
MAYSYAIDTALKSALHNKINVTIEGITYPVTAVIQAPEEQFQKGKYPVPSIGVYLFDIVHKPERESDKIWQYSDMDTDPTPKFMKKRPAPVKFDFRYQITTATYFAEHDRKLTKLIHNTLPPRGFIPVTEEGVTSPQKYKLETYFEGFQSLDTMGEYRMFRKALTYRVLGWLDEGLLTTQKLVYTGINIDVDGMSPTGGIDVGVANSTMTDIDAR